MTVYGKAFRFGCAVASIALLASTMAGCIRPRDNLLPLLEFLSPTSTVLTNQTTTAIELAFEDEAEGSGIDLSSFQLLVDQADVTSTCTVAEGSATCTSPTLAAGAHTLTATISDKAGNVQTAAFAFNVVLPLAVTITEPADGMLTAGDTVTVSGTVSGPATAVTVNSLSAQLTKGPGGGTFSLDVSLREGSNILTAIASGAAGETGASTARVTRDTHAPNVTIDTPADGSIVDTATVAITGSVGDTVVGPVTNANCDVVISGRTGMVVAVIENGAFLADNFPLTPGVNILTAVATDAVGNESVPFQVRITRQDQPGQRLKLISGGGQMGEAGGLLDAPIVVRAETAGGDPIANRLLTATVSKNNGALGPFAKTTETFRTDANGEIQFGWTLGGRAGMGNNRVTVSGAGFPIPVNVCASAVGSDCAMLVADGVVSASGIAGQPLAQPFVAIALDANGNRCPDQVITFTVIEGDGTINGVASVDITTGPDGTASALLTLGAMPGSSNNVVRATAGSVDEFGVSFVASAMAPDKSITTSLTGVLLDTEDRPVPGATVSILDANPAVTAVSDDAGIFLLEGVPTGSQLFVVDGTTSTRTETIPGIELFVDILPGVINELSQPAHLPILDDDNFQFVGGGEDVDLTMDGVEGFSLKVFAGSAEFPNGATTGNMGVTQVSNDQVPMPPNGGAAPPWVGTFQPPNVHFDPPAQLTVPNSLGLPSGTIVNLFSFDHHLGMYVGVGTGTVQPNGASIVSDPGSGISVSGWFFDCPPPPPQARVNNNKDPLKDKTVRDDWKKAWKDSNPGPGTDPKRQEQGGWIVRDPNTGVFSIQRWPSGEAAGIQPTPEPANVVGCFHTHPNLGPEWKAEPSNADLNWTAAKPDQRSPHYVISEKRIFRINKDGTVDDVAARDDC